MIDNWLPGRLRHFAALVRAERSILTAFGALLAGWLGLVRQRVLVDNHVDLAATYSTVPTFTLGVDRIVDVQITDLFTDAYEQVVEGDPDEHLRRYLAEARNRMVRTPDSVFELIRHEVTQATTRGDSVDELAARVEEILTTTGTDNWRGRAMTVARTEAIGAYNAGTFAGFLDHAGAAGGSWEKLWLATEDERTRPTHRTADGQRVPLSEPFRVGQAALMFPGDPSGPPEEVIQCRCTPLLVRPGEQVDYSNRQYRGPR